MFIGGAYSRPYRVDPPRAKKLRGNSTARGSKCALAVFRRWAHRAAPKKAAHPPWGCPIGRPRVWGRPRLRKHGAARQHSAPPGARAARPALRKNPWGTPGVLQTPGGTLVTPGVPRGWDPSLIFAGQTELRGVQVAAVHGAPGVLVVGAVDLDDGREAGLVR